MTGPPTDAPGSLDVAVVGSINHDLGIPLARPPRPGETLLGGDVRWSPGGKGANQAVGCARLGLRTAMVGAVGTDRSGRQLIETFQSEAVDVSHVFEVDAPTGLAVVMVDRSGESTIVVSPGANGRLDAAHVDTARQTVESARAVLCQLEVPVATVQRAAELATGLVMLNPAPGRRLDPELLSRVDVLVPNRHELAALAGRDRPRTLPEVEQAVRSLGGRPRATVVTLGSDGALIVEDGTAEHVPALPVQPVDTTGAGDSFCAALAAGLLGGASLLEAAREATRVAAATTLRAGAMTSLPRRDELRELLGAVDG